MLIWLRKDIYNKGKEVYNQLLNSQKLSQVMDKFRLKDKWEHINIICAAFSNVSNKRL